MNALPPPPSQPPGRGTAPAIPTSPTATAPPARGAVATAPATNDAPAASKAPVPPPSGSPQSRCQLPIVQDLPCNRRRRGSETALPAPSAGPASPEGPTHKQIDGSPPPTHSAGSGRGKPADPQDQSVHGSNAPHHTGNPAHLVTASATPLVISLDSQNQDYLPDLSGPTGNCQKLAAEFRVWGDRVRDWCRCDRGVSRRRAGHRGERMEAADPHVRWPAAPDGPGMGGDLLRSQLGRTQQKAGGLPLPGDPRTVAPVGARR